MWLCQTNTIIENCVLIYANSCTSKHWTKGSETWLLLIKDFSQSVHTLTFVFKQKPLYNVNGHWRVPQLPKKPLDNRQVFNDWWKSGEWWWKLIQEQSGVYILRRNIRLSRCCTKHKLSTTNKFFFFIIYIGKPCFALEANREKVFVSPQAKEFFLGSLVN